MRDGAILIVGGGVGGLAAAVALRRAGFEALVFERADEIREVGAGLTVQNNGMAALRRLGLDQEVAARGEVLRRASLLRWDGMALSSLELANVTIELGAPAVGIHRARLLAVLLGALDPAAVSTGSEAAGFEADRDGITLALRDGRHVRGAALVGADGLQSLVRSRLLGDGPPRPAGYLAWRGVCAPPQPPLDGAAVETWGCGRRFGRLGIGDGRVYWYATLNSRAVPAGAGSDPSSTQADLLRLFAGWHPPVTALIAATPSEAILRSDLWYRPPARRWGHGRVTLLGDAAHPMTPDLGQGACQAIEDAVVLAAALRDTTDLARGLRTYEAWRRPLANRVCSRSRRAGRIAQWQRRPMCALRDQMVRLMPASAAQRQLLATLRFHEPPPRPSSMCHNAPAAPFRKTMVNGEPEIVIATARLEPSALAWLVEAFFGDMVKYVVDVERRIAAVGGELHADAEQVLLDGGSRQADLWGANYYPGKGPDHCIEYTALINIRPAQGNRGMLIADESIRSRVREITFALIGHGEPLA